METPQPTLPPQRLVLLVDFYWTRDKDPRLPLGHASLLAALSTLPTLDVRSLVIAVNGPHSKAAAIVRRILGGLQHAA